MSYYRACFLVLCALPAFSVAALAQNQNQNKNQTQTQKPAVVQQKPAASQQLNYANQGTAQRNHVFDGTQKPANPVQANTAPKPNPVGQPVYSTSGNPGYKPQQSLHTNPVPSPTVARSTTTVTSTPTVARSSSTATTQSNNNNKKP
jgi:hypothetical protein